MTEIDLKRYVDDNERRYKAAFMALLDDYRKLNADFDDEDFCKNFCPLCEPTN